MHITARFSVALVLAGLILGCRGSNAAPGGSQSSDLRSIIIEQIRIHVRESYGEFAGENFSDADLTDFEARKVPSRIAADLKTNKLFLSAVEKVRAMVPGDRAEYLKKCRLPWRPTWAEQGKIDRNGTTDAGRQAELEIAGAITDLAESLLASNANNVGR